MRALKLPRLPRRNPDRPSLKQRMASLKAAAGRVMRTPGEQTSARLPEPGSAEAVAAWHAAIGEHSRLCRPLHDCPELMRSDSECWTIARLGKALSTGEVSVAEYARLHPIASARELRLAEITHRLTIGPLFALAYADSYPEPAHGVSASVSRDYTPEWEGLPDPWSVLKVDLTALSPLELAAVNRVAEGLANAAVALGEVPDASLGREYTAAGAFAFWAMELSGRLIDDARTEAFRRLAEDNADGAGEHYALVGIVARYVAETGEPKQMRAVFGASAEAQPHG